MRFDLNRHRQFSSELDHSNEPIVILGRHRDLRQHVRFVLFVLRLESGRLKKIVDRLDLRHLHAYSCAVDKYRPAAALVAIVDDDGGTFVDEEFQYLASVVQHFCKILQRIGRDGLAVT